jgi:hypothetical protein
MFPMPPQILHWIQFRGIGGKIFDDDLAMEFTNKVPHQPAAVSRESIPDDQQPAGQVSEQVAKKLQHLFGTDGSFEDLKVEVPPGHSRRHRNSLPIEVILQDRCLAAGSPGTTTMWPLAQSAFVDEDDRAAFILGFFLRAGQRSVFHC